MPTIPAPSLRLFLILQFLIGGLLALSGTRLGSPQLGASIGAGAALVLLNTALIGWIWRRLMAQKTIAWTMLVIVIKYAVLLTSIYYLTRLDWFNPIGAGVGISSFMLAALALAYFFKRAEFGNL